MRPILATTIALALLGAACASDDDGSAATDPAVTGSPADGTAPSSDTDTGDTDTDDVVTGDTDTDVVTDPSSPATTPTTASTGETTTTETTTTLAPEPDVTGADLATDGPYEVGVVTRALPEGNAVEIWYPATDAADGSTVAYNVRDFLPAPIAALVPDTVDDSRAIEALRDADPADDGPFPIVLFSHGSTSFRLQSSVLARHLASWGIVTASTDHRSRDLMNVIGATTEGQPPSVDDFRSLRTTLSTLDDDPVLGGVLDDERIALGGHSAGGGTIVQMAGDDGILGYVSYASGLGDEAPDVPSLFMAGELDAIVDPVERTAAAFDAAPAPSWLWSFAGAGHLAFSDLCAVGSEGATLIDLAEAAGLGALVDDRLRTLGTDGCEEPNRPVEDVWPGVHQAATGFYRWVFGIDAAPIGLDESAVTTGVTVTTKESTES